MHLFDIDVKGGIRFKESDSLSPGNSLAFLDLDGFKIGIGICYDIRFDELARIYRNNGCDMLLYPAAFNMTTGPMHWELLQRGRANDLQLFVTTISPGWLAFKKRAKQKFFLLQNNYFFAQYIFQHFFFLLERIRFHLFF